MPLPSRAGDDVPDWVGRATLALIATVAVALGVGVAIV